MLCIISLRGMLLQIGAFGAIADVTDPALYKGPCEAAFESFTKWRKDHHIQSSQKPFRYRFVFNDEYGMYMNCKGFNARCVSEWLMYVLICIRLGNWHVGDLSHDDRLLWAESALILGWN